MEHSAITASLRDFDTMVATLAAGLRDRPYLLGDSHSAADLVCSSPFMWFAEMTPDDPVITSWVQRCRDRPAAQRTAARDTA